MCVEPNCKQCSLVRHFASWGSSGRLAVVSTIVIVLLSPSLQFVDKSSSPLHGMVLWMQITQYRECSLTCPLFSFIPFCIYIFQRFDCNHLYLIKLPDFNWPRNKYSVKWKGLSGLKTTRIIPYKILLQCWKMLRNVVSYVYEYTILKVCTME